MNTQALLADDDPKFQIENDLTRDLRSQISALPATADPRERLALNERLEAVLAERRAAVLDALAHRIVDVASELDETLGPFYYKLRQLARYARLLESQYTQRVTFDGRTQLRPEVEKRFGPLAGIPLFWRARITDEAIDLWCKTLQKCRTKAEASR
jgi:hypothetical protein